MPISLVRPLMRRSPTFAGVPLLYFKSDTNAEPLEAYYDAARKANVGFTDTYATDPTTLEAQRVFEAQFGTGTMAFFVNTGTAANIHALKPLLSTKDAIVCANTAHIKDLEAGAPFAEIGCGLITPRTDDRGQFTVGDVEQALQQGGRFGAKFNTHAKVISISQPTELGVIWQPQDIKRLARFAHRHGMILHMDGARLWHAAARTGLSLKALTTDVGVDVLSLGGTKVGMDEAEAIVFLPGFFKHAPAAMGINGGKLDRNSFEIDMYRQLKQAGHLPAKYPKRPAQFIRAFQNNLGIQTAAQANAQADALQMVLKKALEPELLNPIPRQQRTNAVYLSLPRRIKEALSNAYGFFTWSDIDPKRSDYFTARLLTSSQVTLAHIRGFKDTLTALLEGQRYYDDFATNT